MIYVYHGFLSCDIFLEVSEGLGEGEELEVKSRESLLRPFEGAYAGSKVTQLRGFRIQFYNIITYGQRANGL